MLRREERLQSAAEFRAVYRGGEVFPGRLVIAYVMRASAGKKAGVVVSKRVGSAVKRNRVKRVIREALRARLAVASGGLRVVVRARPAASGARPGEIAAEVEDLLARAGVFRAGGG